MTPQRNAPDTHRRRDADAARVRRVAGERFAGFRRLHFYTLPLPLPEGTPLHSETASRAARVVVESVFGAAPTRWKLERGRGGGLHIHAVSPLPPVAVHAAQHVETVYNLRRLLAYFAKPADARLCESSRPTAYTPDSATRARDYRDALEERAALRRDRLRVGKRRLPPVSGWSGTRPTSNPAPMLPARAALGFVLALLAALLAPLLASLRPAAPRPAPMPRPAPRCPSTGFLAPSLRRRRTHQPGAPDRPIRGSAR